jgi:hypothetical protein
LTKTVLGVLVGWFLALLAMEIIDSVLARRRKKLLSWRYDDLRWDNIPTPRPDEWYIVITPWGVEEHRWDGKKLHVRPHHCTIVKRAVVEDR